MEQPRQPSLFQIIISFTLFLALAGSFTAIFHLPIQLVLFISWFIMMGLGITLKHTYSNLEKSIIKGISQGLIAILILIAVGALAGTWIKGGIVPGIIYYGLLILKPSIFLPACLIICAITSLATGTSWGTVGTAGIAMMGVGSSMGISGPLVAGAVLSGAYFGDKLSPMSDSVILASALSQVEVTDHIRGMLPISLTGFVITFVAFSIAGLFYVEPAHISQINDTVNELNRTFNINILIFIPVIITISLLAIKKPAFPVICLGALLGSLWAVFFQHVSPFHAIESIYLPERIITGNQLLDKLLTRGGIESMLPSIVIIIFGLGLGGLMDEIGILKVITDRLHKWTKGTTSVTITTIICAFFANVFGSAMYVSLILTPKMMAQSYDKLHLHRKMLSRNTEFGGTLTSGMVPWSDNGIFMSTLLGISTFSYTPFMWLSFSCIIVAIIFSMKGWCTYYANTPPK